MGGGGLPLGRHRLPRLQAAGDREGRRGSDRDAPARAGVHRESGAAARYRGRGRGESARGGARDHGGSAPRDAPAGRLSIPMAKPELTIIISNPSPEPHPSEAAPEQVEMPFAVVNGEPVTELPRDLYIPPQALEVFLEAFEGPLDLLLYLIRRQNLDILDIPIAEITRQYMEYIDLMKEMQLELAGEYLVMAAMLAEIKSRMLLPRPPIEEGEEMDPRAELVRRLQEYERYKQAGEDLDAMPRVNRDVYSSAAEMHERKAVHLVPDVTMKELLISFKEVLH